MRPSSGLENPWPNRSRPDSFRLGRMGSAFRIVICWRASRCSVERGGFGGEVRMSGAYKFGF